MVLVVKEIPQSNNLVGTSITPVSEQTIGSQSSVTSVYLKTGLQDPSILRILNRRSQMMTITYPVRVRSEFDLFLEYAQSKTDGAVDAEFDSFDNYLGSLGV